MFLKKSLINLLIGIECIVITTIMFSIIDFPGITGGGLTGGFFLFLLMSVLIFFFMLRAIFFLVRHFVSPPFYEHKKKIGYAIIVAVSIIIIAIAVWFILNYTPEMDGAGG